MTMQFSDAVRNACANAIETTIGTTPTLTIRSGAAPANCAAADAGTVLATIALPSDWLADAAAGIKALAGVWEDLAADATGTAAHYRIKQGGTCHNQGTVTLTGGGGDLQVDSLSFTAGQAFAITAFSYTVGGA